MLLQLKPLFLGEKERLPLDCALDLSGVEFQNSFPFRQPVKVTGEVVASAGLVTLRAKAVFSFEGQCDRCTRPICRSQSVQMEHILVISLNDEENDDFILIDNYQLPLDDLVATDLILALPSKNLCKEDCRGLCPMCGKDLNEGPCGCKPQTANSQFEALRQLLD